MIKINSESSPRHFRAANWLPLLRQANLPPPCSHLCSVRVVAGPGPICLAPKACSRGARRQEKGIDGGGERSHRSLSPSANRPAQLAGPTHPPQTRRPHPHCPPTRRDVPRAVAAPSPALLVSKLAAVDSVTTWVLRLRRDGHIGSLPGLLCVRSTARATARRVGVLVC